MVDIPEEEDEEEQEEESIRTITDGVFEEEFRVDSEKAGEFLVGLGEQLRDGESVTVSGEDWEIPFEFRDPVELEIEFEGYDDEGELEIEIELVRAETDSTLDVS